MGGQLGTGGACQLRPGPKEGGRMLQGAFSQAKRATTGGFIGANSSRGVWQETRRYPTVLYSSFRHHIPRPCVLVYCIVK